jgi:hypothetical protein
MVFDFDTTLITILCLLNHLLARTMDYNSKSLGEFAGILLFCDTIGDFNQMR